MLSTAYPHVIHSHPPTDAMHRAGALRAWVGAGAAPCRNIRTLRAGNPPTKPSSRCFGGVVTVSAGVRWAFDGSSPSVRWANGGIFWCFELYALPTVLSSQVEFSVVTIFFFLNSRQRTEGTVGSCYNSEHQKMPPFPHHSPIVF